MTTKSQAEPVSPESDSEMSSGAKRRAERLERRQRKAKEHQEKAQEQAQKRVEEVLSEGLTGKQLRNATRLARRNGIDAVDPYDAFQKLRDKGVDPNAPANPIHLVVDNDRPKDVALPVPVVSSVSPAQMADEKRHMLEVARIQEAIARRRSHKLYQMGFYLYVWVLVPTLAALFYFAQIATPMYSTTAEFIVQKSAPAAGLDSFLSGAGAGSAQEAVAVQRYVESKEAMVRLDAEHGFAAHFSAAEVDPIGRLDPEATIETAYKLYRKRVKLGYDPTEGVVSMEVIARDPETAVRFANALVGYAEDVVNNLSLRQRQDQLNGAEAAFAQAEAEMQAAQRRVIELQEQRGIISAEAEVSSLMTQIATFELELRQQELTLGSLLDNPRPNSARVAGTRAAIDRLNATIASLREDLTATSPDNASLARISSELKIAETALLSRQAMFEEALQTLQSARRDAIRQVGYLALNVSPVTPEDSAYPRVPQNTAMAFLIFAGIYMLVSLTTSVLKEQVSS